MKKIHQTFSIKKIQDSPITSKLTKMCFSTIDALPAVNGSCYAAPAVAAGVNTHSSVQLPTEYREVNTFDSDVQTVVRENNNYTTFNKDVITTVNRNHLHTQRIVTNENQHNTYITNNITRVNDIHRQRIENLKGETRNFRDFKATQRVEAAGCSRDAPVAVAVAAPAPIAVAATPALSVARSIAPARSIALTASPALSVAASARSLRL